MRISFNWLKEFVDIPEGAQELVNRFTNVGLAVDALETAGHDSVFDLDIATNRPDCLSHLGIAREVGAIYGSVLRTPKFALREAERRAQEAFPIAIADPDLRACYRGRSIASLKDGPSPPGLEA